jgi:hypothetical protein
MGFHIVIACKSVLLGIYPHKGMSIGMLLIKGLMMSDFRVFKKYIGKRVLLFTSSTIGNPIEVRILGVSEDEQWFKYIVAGDCYTQWKQCKYYSITSIKKGRLTKIMEAIYGAILR